MDIQRWARYDSQDGYETKVDYNTSTATVQCIGGTVQQLHGHRQHQIASTRLSMLVEYECCQRQIHQSCSTCMEFQ